MKKLWQKLMCRLGKHDYYVRTWYTKEPGAYDDVSFQVYKVTVEHHRVECRACDWTERSD